MRVLVVTTSRADWNSLGMVAKALREKGAEMCVAITGPHLEAVRDDGLIEGMRELRVPGQFGSPWAPLSHFDATILRSVSDAVEAVRPDMAVLCGDRHETLAAAFALAMAGVPIAHLAGGDVTGGSLDERWRHAISKIADLHFPAHPAAVTRLLLMGEDIEHIYPLGSASIDRLRTTPLLGAKEFREATGMETGRFVLFNWQPETGEQGAGLLCALVGMAGSARVLCVGPNNDEGHELVDRMLTETAEARGRDWRYVKNLPPAVYLTALKHADVLVGNSSSAIYEAPQYGTPSVNIGDRQMGRGPRPKGMRDVRPAGREIEAAVLAQSRAPRLVEHLFGDGHAAERIAATILSYEGKRLEPKRFRD